MQPRPPCSPFLAALLLAACAPDLAGSLADGSESGALPEGSGASSEGGGEDEGSGPQVQHQDEGGGVTRSTVDATSEEQWVYLDLESGQQLDVADGTQSAAWDLGFRRTTIAIDGGISGPGGMEAVALEGVAFADVTEVPAEGWVTDAADGDDDDMEPDLALAGWYAYDFMTHVLTPLPLVYVVRTVEGNAYKLEVLDYYDEAGTSAVYTIRWAPLVE